METPVLLRRSEPLRQKSRDCGNCIFSLPWDASRVNEKTALPGKKLGQDKSKKEESAIAPGSLPSLKPTPVFVPELAKILPAAALVCAVEDEIK